MFASSFNCLSKSSFSCGVVFKERSPMKPCFSSFDSAIILPGTLLIILFVYIIFTYDLKNCNIVDNFCWFSKSSLRRHELTAHHLVWNLMMITKIWIEFKSILSWYYSINKQRHRKAHKKPLCTIDIDMMSLSQDERPFEYRTQSGCFTLFNWFSQLQLVPEISRLNYNNFNQSK